VRRYRSLLKFPIFHRFWWSVASEKCSYNGLEWNSLQTDQDSHTSHIAFQTPFNAFFPFELLVYIHLKKQINFQHPTSIEINSGEIISFPIVNTMVLPNIFKDNKVYVSERIKLNKHCVNWMSTVRALYQHCMSSEIHWISSFRNVLFYIFCQRKSYCG